MYSLTQLNQIVKNAIANGLLDDVDVNIKKVVAEEGLFSGKLTAGELLENQPEYTFNKPDNLELIYVSASKTGNKLSIVIFGSYTPTSNYPSGIYAGSLSNIPSTVGAKLIPYQLGSEYFLDNKRISFFANNNSAIEGYADCQKTDNTNIRFALRLPSGMVVGTKYLFRYECTFLLSANLAPQE